MTPDCRRWTEEMLARCRAQAALAREAAASDRTAAARADCLDRLAADLAGRLAAASATQDLHGPANADFERHLAACEPRMHPVYGIMFNAGPIMADIRSRIEERLGRTPCPAAIGEAPPPPGPPLHDAAPFMAGPQLGLFA